MSSPSFIEACAAGAEPLDAIDDAIDRWHAGGIGQPLWRYLGMTRDEYALWVSNGDLLPAIVASHALGISVETAAERLAGSSADARAAADWLADHQRALITA